MEALINQRGWLLLNSAQMLSFEDVNPMWSNIPIVQEKQKIHSITEFV